MIVWAKTYYELLEQFEAEIEKRQNLAVQLARKDTEIINLKIQLADAKRNDTPKDPATGKFTKKK